MKKLMITFLLMTPLLGQARLSQQKEALEQNLVLSEVQQSTKILSRVSLDINADGVLDQAVLQSSEEDPDRVDLILFVSNEDSKTGQIISKKGIFYYSPENLESSPFLSRWINGTSLKVYSRYIEASQVVWQKSLTIAFQNNQFVVSGMNLVYNDKGNQHTQECDINFLTGEGVRNGKKVTEKLDLVTLDHWNEDNEPKSCVF